METPTTHPTLYFPVSHHPTCPMKEKTVRCIADTDTLDHMLKRSIQQTTTRQLGMVQCHCRPTINTDSQLDLMLAGASDAARQNTEVFLYPVIPFPDPIILSTQVQRLSRASTPRPNRNNSGNRSNPAIPNSMANISMGSSYHPSNTTSSVPETQTDQMDREYPVANLSQSRHATNETALPNPPLDTQSSAFEWSPSHSREQQAPPFFENFQNAQESGPATQNQFFPATPGTAGQGPSGPSPTIATAQMNAIVHTLPAKLDLLLWRIENLTQQNKDIRSVVGELRGNTRHIETCVEKAEKLCGDMWTNGQETLDKVDYLRNQDLIRYGPNRNKSFHPLPTKPAAPAPSSKPTGPSTRVNPHVIVPPPAPPHPPPAPTPPARHATSRPKHYPAPP